MLKNDKVNIVIALLIAIGLWAYVMVEVNPEKDSPYKDVPITFLNTETLTDNGLILLSSSDVEVDVNVKGRVSDLKGVKKEDIKIYADLEGYKAGEHTIRLQIGRISNVEIETKQKISVVIDQLVTETKPIAVSMSGTVSDEIEPYIVQVSETEVAVTGAKTLVDSISKIDAPLDISKVGVQLKAFTVNLYPVNKEGHRVENVQLNTASVSVSAVNLAKKTVRLNVPVEGIESTDVERTVTLPKTITIKGLSADLNAVDLIAAEPLDVSGIYEDTVLKVTPILPDGVEAAANSQNLEAEVTVRGMGSRNFEYGREAVIAEGAAENMKVTIEDVDILLHVTGRDSIVEALTGDEFGFVVNVRNMKPGVHRVILNCRYDVQLSRVDFEPEVITVEIAANEETDNPDAGEDIAPAVPDGENGKETGTEGSSEAVVNPENVPAA